MMERVELMSDGRVRVVSRVAHRGPIAPADLFRLLPPVRTGFRRTAAFAGTRRDGRLSGATVIDEEFTVRL